VPKSQLGWRAVNFRAAIACGNACGLLHFTLVKRVSSPTAKLN
jgi:hypothetical protein